MKRTQNEPTFGNLKIEKERKQLLRPFQKSSQKGILLLINGLFKLLGVGYQIDSVGSHDVACSPDRGANFAIALFFLISLGVGKLRMKILATWQIRILIFLPIIVNKNSTLEILAPLSGEHATSSEPICYPTPSSLMTIIFFQRGKLEL